MRCVEMKINGIIIFVLMVFIITVMFHMMSLKTVENFQELRPEDVCMRLMSPETCSKILKPKVS